MKFFQTVYNTAHTPEEAAVAAKYDLIVVKQTPAAGGSSHAAFTQWLGAVKSANPSIKILSYMIVAQEPGFFAPGVGNSILMNWPSYAPYGQEPWLMTPAGDIAAITEGWKVRRLFDYRKPVWRDLFKQSVIAVMSSYSYDGMFFDNCTASWAKHAPNQPALTAALQSALLDIRYLYPDKYFVGNGAENWMGLNGEMNEGRANQAEELIPSNGQVVPNLNMYYMLATVATPDSEIQAGWNLARSKGALFGCYDPARAVFWPPVFDALA